MKPETVAAVALDILRERGWYQGGFDGADGSVCVGKAVMCATENEPHACLVTFGRIRQIAGDIARWNDDPHTTFEDVQLVLKRVANGEGVE